MGLLAGPTPLAGCEARACWRGTVNSSVLEGTEEAVCECSVGRGRETQEGRHKPGAEPWPPAPALGPSRLFTVRRPSVCPASAGVLLEGFLT